MDKLGYRDILKRHFAERLEDNPRYSLRAFSRDLKISPSRLSEILNGKQGLSEKWALKIAHGLRLNKSETEKFLQKVLASDGRAKRTREKAIEMLTQTAQETEFQQLDFETFKVISDWYHFAILELSKVKGFKAEASWIGKRLGINEYEAKMAVDRLLRLGLLQYKNGKLKATDRQLTTTNGIPSEAIQRFNRQILDKAKESILTQGLDERDISTLTVAVKKADIPRVIEKIKKFRRELNAELEKSISKTGGDEVYNLALQFFRLTQKDKS